MKPIVQVASLKHQHFAEDICQLIQDSARKRGTGIAKRSPEYIKTKIAEQKAIIALTPANDLIGFCYIESWGDKEYVANSGLIVKSEYRGTGTATMIKKKAFEHSCKMFPNAKLFGLTTSLPVMKINSELGYVPVTYNQLTDDEAFWKGCRSCTNYEILMKKEKAHCMCTAMLFDPKKKPTKRWDFVKKWKVYERFMNLKKQNLAT